MLGCIFAGVSLVIATHVRPYQKEVTNGLSNALHYLIFSTYVLGLCLRFDDLGVNNGVTMVGEQSRSLTMIGQYSKSQFKFYSLRAG